jgi:hypothetical protein
MPFVVDPFAIQRIVLSSDEGKSPQPAFLYRHLSFRKFAELEALRASIGKEEFSESIRKQFAALADGLVGWENIHGPAGEPIPFNPDAMPDLLTISEAQEILIKRLTGAVPSVDDKKKLPSPSPSDTESSVKDAKAQPDAPTSQDPNCPQLQPV